MAKRLIVCCDGTWNTADQISSGKPCPTNITKIAVSIAPEDSAGVRQCVYYHSGVGTSRRERLRGGAFGIGLSRNVFDAYQFLRDNYEDGDELFFFGFSRGAFTARSIAGLVRNCGILRTENADRMREAWALYRSAAENPRGVASTLFRRAYSHDPWIHFIGVFDTVGALGVPAFGPRWLRPVVRRINSRWEFHDTTLSSHVHGAFHALAIDEQRAAFQPTLWHQQPNAHGQELKQVWFTGVHCDVGGGYSDASLSDISLLWMVDRAREYGLQFVPGAFSPQGPQEMSPSQSTDFKVAPNPMAPAHNSRTKFYRLMRPWNRPIGALPDGREWLAATAETRYDEDEQYQAPALMAYLEDRENVRVEQVSSAGTALPRPAVRTAAPVSCASRR